MLNQLYELCWLLAMIRKVYVSKNSLWLSDAITSLLGMLLSLLHDYSGIALPGLFTRPGSPQHLSLTGLLTSLCY